MKQIGRFSCVLLHLCLVVVLFSGCSTYSSNTSDKGGQRFTRSTFLIPEALGTITYGSDTVSIDASNTSEGYIMVSYTGSVSKVKLQITIPDDTVYTYNLKSGSYETFPLSGGNGSYHIDVLENVTGNMYSLLFSQDIQVSISDPLKPFLYPNQYAWFTSDSKVVALAKELSDKSSSDLDFVEKVYDYVITNITYDTVLAQNTSKNYIPDVDATLASGKGICFDYAALMCSMLRSQNIPTKLVVGYSGTVYHAWISVYLEESGWVDNVIEFDGRSWTLMDPTLAANNDKQSVKKYVSDGSNYTVSYSY